MRESYNLYPYLIFLTGDVAFGQIGNTKGLSLKDQYEEAKEFLERMLNIFPRVPIYNIFIVPGNHDVNRTLVTNEQVAWLDSLRRDKRKDGSKIINELIKNDSLQRKRYMKRLNDYKSFLEGGGYWQRLSN